MVQRRYAFGSKVYLASGSSDVEQLLNYLTRSFVAPAERV
jgi:hypothetical protein